MHPNENEGEKMSFEKKPVHDHLCSKSVSPFNQYQSTGYVTLNAIVHAKQ